MTASQYHLIVSTNGWIWNNDRSTDEILDWLRSRDPAEREEIDISATDSVIHFRINSKLRCTSNQVA